MEFRRRRRHAVSALSVQRGPTSRHGAKKTRQYYLEEIKNVTNEMWVSTTPTASSVNTTHFHVNTF
jgi:hypothetical protein